MRVSEATLLNEQEILRNELQELKKCQIQYFLLSIGATGAIFGFTKDLFEEIKAGSLLYLAPLIVILPCWLTFFDKANTITRLTGYIRVFLEDQLKNGVYQYHGYENALSEFRRKEKEYIKQLRKERELKQIDWLAIFNFTRNQYWKINWLTFLFLSLTCCFYPFFKNMDYLQNHQPNRIVLLIFILAVIICTFYSLFILWRLMIGVYSYENVKKIWSKVLENIT